MKSLFRLGIVGWLVCGFASHAGAQGNTAADMSGALGCVNKIMSDANPAQPLSAQQKTAYTKCFTSNGLPAPAQTALATLSAEQIKAQSDCIAAHGGSQVSPSGDPRDLATPENLQIVALCSQSAGIPAQKQDDSPQGIAKAKQDAAMACAQKIMPLRDSDAAGNSNAAGSQLTESQRAAVEHCYADNGIPLLPKLTAEQGKFVQTCIAARRSIVPQAGYDDKAAVQDCMSQAGIDTSQISGFLNGATPAAAPPTQAQMQQVIADCMARGGKTNVARTLDASLIKDCMSAAGVNASNIVMMPGPPPTATQP